MITTSTISKRKWHIPTSPSKIHCRWPNGESSKCTSQSGTTGVLICEQCSWHPDAIDEKVHVYAPCETLKFLGPIYAEPGLPGGVATVSHAGRGYFR